MTATRLYVRCLGWGLATGAVAGGGPTALLGIFAGASLGDVRLTLLVTAAGVFYGVLVAVAPTVLGGLAVVIVLSLRHPRPANFDAVNRDLTVVFVTVLAVLDAAALAGWVLLGGWETLLAALVVVLVVNVAAGVTLRLARPSIARAWVGDSGDVPPPRPPWRSYWWPLRSG